MLGREIFVEVHVLHRQGKSIRQISRELGISRNTVRSRLRAEEVPVARTRVKKPTKLDNYRGYLQARIATARPDWIPASVLFEEIREQGYTGCVTTVRNYVRTMKPAPRPDPVVRFETEPGHQMQVDWGCSGSMANAYRCSYPHWAGVATHTAYLSITNDSKRCAPAMNRLLKH